MGWMEWGKCSYESAVRLILHQGRTTKPKKKGPTAWVRKAITEAEKGKRVVLVIRWTSGFDATRGRRRFSNLGDVRWHATEDGSVNPGHGSALPSLCRRCERGIQRNIAGRLTWQLHPQNQHPSRIKPDTVATLKNSNKHRTS